MTTPKKDVAYKFFITLGDKNDSSKFKADPTLATGDFKVSVDEGVTFDDLDTPAVVTASGSIWVKISLTTAEMADNKVLFQAIDVAGDEWSDFSTFIDAPDRNVVDLVSVLGNGTAQSGTASTIVLAAADAFADDVLDGTIIKIIAGTGVGQARVIISNTLADDTANITPDWTINPSSDSVYEIVAGSVNVEAISLSDPETVLESEANDALVANHLDHFFAVDYDPSSIPGVSGAWANELTEDDGNAEIRFTANALSQSPASGGGFVTTNYRFSTNTAATDPGSGVVKFNNSTPASVTQIFISQITSNGANIAEIIESLVSGDNVTVGQEDDGSKFIRADVNGTIVDGGAFYTIPVTILDSGTLIGNNKSTLVLFGKPAATTAEITTSVWAALKSANNDAGSMGLAMGDIDTETGKIGTVSDLGSGATLGENLLDMAGATFDTATDSQEEIRDNQPTNFSSLVITPGGAVDSLVQGFLNTIIAETSAGNIAANFDNLYDNGDTLATLTLDTISILTAANVNTQVVDVIRTDTVAELTAVPAASEDLHTMVQYIFQKIRNEETSTSTAATISKADGTVISTAVQSDDGVTFTKAVHT